MNVEIAERLAARRKEAGFSQEALAEKLGVTRQAVSKWERSESSPDTDNLIALAQLYGLSLDDLLYVDSSIRDDVAFEAQDRARQYRADTTAAGVGADAGAGAGAGADADEWFAPTDDAAAAEPAADYAGAAPDKDYVHINWRDGIHVKDAKTGEEVHVSWNGVHVKNPKREDEKPDDAQPVEAFVIDDEDDSRHWTPGVSVEINGEHYDSWKEAQDKHWFIVDDWKRSSKSPWMKFPFTLLALIAYLLMGILLNAWAVGLFIFFSIPLYHMLVAAIVRRKPSMFFTGIYPILAVAWFFWMAFVLNQAHPAWVIFLTIPIYEWLVISVRNWWSRRKRGAPAPGTSADSATPSAE
jgi:HTH-type transcriptional regulator/antitoxin HipB